MQAVNNLKALICVEWILNIVNWLIENLSAKYAVLKIQNGYHWKKFKNLKKSSL